MNRTLCAVFVALGAFVAVTGAQAKAPFSGIDICGADNACVHLDWQQAENEKYWALWASANAPSVPPAAVAPFLIVRWSWSERDNRTAYYIPSTGQVRQHDPTTTFSSWFNLADPSAVRTMTAGLATYPVPGVTRVTVGGRPVRDPQSYLRIFGAGEGWFAPILPNWLRIRFFGDGASPWTDNADDIFISRKGRLMWMDGDIVRIPLQLAQRIRARRSLAP